MKHNTIERFGTGWLGSAVFAAAILATVAVLALASGCATARGLARLDSMTPDELGRYTARVSLQVQVVADVLLAEGDISTATALGVAMALDGIAAGTTAPAAGGIAHELGLRGYGALAVQLAVVELDAALEERGAYDPGGWGRAAEVLAAVSAGIRRAAGEL